MIRRFEVGNFEFDELGAVVLPRAEGDWKNHHAKWVHRITWDNAVERRLLLGTSMFIKSRPIFLKVLAKMRLRPLPPSISNLVNLTSATTGSRTRGNLPGSEKLVH
jgi:hypothetical protein